LNYIFSTQFINNYYQSSSTSCGLGSLFVWVNEQRCLWRSLRFSPSSSSVFNYFVNIRSQFCGSLLGLLQFFMIFTGSSWPFSYMIFTGSSLDLHWFFIVMFTGSSMFTSSSVVLHGVDWFFIVVFTGYSLDLQWLFMFTGSHCVH